MKTKGHIIYGNSSAVASGAGGTWGIYGNSSAVASGAGGACFIFNI